MAILCDLALSIKNSLCKESIQTASGTGFRGYLYTSIYGNEIHRVWATPNNTSMQFTYLLVNLGE